MLFWLEAALGLDLSHSNLLGRVRGGISVTLLKDPRAHVKQRERRRLQRHCFVLLA